MQRCKAGGPARGSRYAEQIEDGKADRQAPGGDVLNGVT